MQKSKNKVKAPTFSSIGKSAPKIEGVQKVSGQARYTADYLLPGTIWGKVLRSPYPHARIVRMDTSRAKAQPGVMAVLTAAEDRKSTRLNSSHTVISYAVFCLKKKKRW